MEYASAGDETEDGFLLVKRNDTCLPRQMTPTDTTDNDKGAWFVHAPFRMIEAVRFSPRSRALASTWSPLRFL